MTFEWILRPLFQRYWRWQRGMTLGARGIVLDAEGRCLLVRQTYSPGWIFPGGGVEYGETIEAALVRELMEEGNIDVTGPVELLGIYSNAAVFPGDHVAIYVVRHWRQTRTPEATLEIAETGFFPTDALPEGTTRGTRARLEELLVGRKPSTFW
ncbi:MAG: NUDIX domain-containing protein [Hyphomicrobiaceae bacterium]